MALRGKGMLVVFAEVKAGHERDFNEWYNREHIDERVNLPGFRRARRYVAVAATPKYLATYECSRVGDLATPGYLARLAHQTPWSNRVTGRFTKFRRLTLSMKVDQTRGIGGSVAAVRFVPDASHRVALFRWLRDEALPQAVTPPGMLGAAAGENDPEVANAPLARQSRDRPRAEADRPEWLVLLEGADAKVAGNTARRLFKLATLRRFGVGEPPAIGTYRLLYGSEPREHLPG
jgi:hypothetical protein